MSAGVDPQLRQELIVGYFQALQAFEVVDCIGKLEAIFELVARYVELPQFSEVGYGCRQHIISDLVLRKAQLFQLHAQANSLNVLQSVLREIKHFEGILASFKLSRVDRGKPVVLN